LPAHAGPPSDDNNVFVKGFDRSQGEDAVREALTTLFSEAGEVANVRLPTDRETGELKGFGFIEFADNAGKVCWVT
jgi:nucleolin